MSLSPESGPPQPAAPSRAWYRSALTGKQATHGIYIEIVVLAIILALEAKQPSDRDIVSSVFGAVVVVVLADAYAHYIGTTIATGVRPSAREMRATLVGEIGALVAVLPVVFLLMLGVAGVIRLDTGFTAAKWTGVAVIGVYAFVAHRRAGLTTGKSFPPAIFLALVGLGLVLLKSYFH